MCRIRLENSVHQIINLDFNDVQELADFMDSMEPVLNLEDIEIIDFENGDDQPCQCSWCLNYANN